MHRMNRGVLLGLWAATLAAAFAIGRGAPTPRAGSAPEEIAASIRAALGEGSTVERFGRTASLLQHLGPENLPEVREVYDQILSVLGECDIRAFVDAWARFDPAAALDHANAWRFKSKRKVGVEAAIYGWALSDPLAARLAFQQIAEDSTDLREGLFHHLVAGWVHSGQERLAAYLAGLTPMAQSAGTALVAGNLGRIGGPEAILRWAEAILRDEAYERPFKRSVFRRAARSVARWQPERAAAWIQEHEGRDYAEDGLRIVAEQWGERDGGASLQWLRDKPAGEPRDRAVRDAFVEWWKVDPVGAETWLASESLTAFHDPAVNAYARRLDDSAPREAVGWCERILDPDLGQRCLGVVANQWYRRDPVAAEAWLQQSPLDEEARRGVRAPPEKRQRAGSAVRPRAGANPR
jgi:hypothetical protein